MSGKAMVCTMAGILFSTFGGATAESVSTPVTTDSGNVLIAYYSWGGNTAKVAGEIQKQTGGTLFQIKPKKPYANDYNTCLQEAKKDIQAKHRPELIAQVEDFDRYKVIFVGSPNWYGTMAPPVAAFLSAYDFKGKTVIPFFTNGGGGMQNCERDVRRLCPGIRILKAATFSGSSVNGLGAWLKNVIKITPNTRKIHAATEKTHVMDQQIIAQKLDLATEWDKTFPKSDKVNHRKITFVNRYGITLAADLYEPKAAGGKFPAVAVSGPFGAVKEQCSGLYAQTLAERGFLTIAFDPSFTGESGGSPRRMASPDINTEDFQAAVDFLSVQPNVDAERIGILGICGWGGLALNTAALDTRIKATIAVTMYQMSRVNANGYFDANNNENARHETRKALNAQRTKEYAQGFHEQAGGVVDPLPADAPQFVKDYYAYYKTPRGYHKRSGNSNDGWTKTGTMSFVNQPMLAYSKEIRSAVLLIHGENAHSRYFSEDAYREMSSYTPYRENKELLIVPGASHTDLYDGGEKKVIPFDKIESFFKHSLK